MKSSPIFDVVLANINDRALGTTFFNRHESDTTISSRFTIRGQFPFRSPQNHTWSDCTGVLKISGLCPRDEVTHYQYREAFSNFLKESACWGGDLKRDFHLYYTHQTSSLHSHPADTHGPRSSLRVRLALYDRCRKLIIAQDP